MESSAETSMEASKMMNMQSQIKLPFQPTPLNSALRGQLKDLGSYQFSFDQKLGSGLTSDAYLGRKKQTQELVCVKIIDLLNFKSESQRLLLRDEIECQKKLQSPYFIRIFDVYDTNSFCFIVTELCRDGDLFKLIKFSRVGLPETLVLKFAQELASALILLKQNKIIHRDIKSENILLSEGHVKLGDFGFSIEEKNLKEKSPLNLGSPLYMPLEALEASRYGYQSDIFSYGIVLYEMLHAQSPWECSEEAELIIRMKNEQISFKSEINPGMKQLIKCCLERDYRTRITIEEVQESLKSLLNSGKSQPSEQ